MIRLVDELSRGEPDDPPAVMPDVQTTRIWLEVWPNKIKRPQRGTIV